MSEPEEIGLNAGEILPDKLILLAQPDPQKLLEMTSGDALVRIVGGCCFTPGCTWRFKSALPKKALIRRLSANKFISIGEVEFEEIRAVLGQEGFLLPPHNDQSVYEEFAAVFLELRYFAWNALPRYFPALEDLDAVAEILRQDVDAQWLFLTTRPLNAPDPVDRSASEDLGPWMGSVDDMPSPPPVTKQIAINAEIQRLMRQARRPLSLGNIVGAAICHVRALNCAPPEKIDLTKAFVKDDVNRLIGRLEAALELYGPQPQPWHDSLRWLLQLRPTDFGLPRPDCCTICKRYA